MGLKQALRGKRMRAITDSPLVGTYTLVRDNSPSKLTVIVTIKLEQPSRPNLTNAVFAFELLCPTILSLLVSLMIRVPYVQPEHKKIKLLTVTYREEKTTDADSPPMGIQAEFVTG